MTVLDHSAQATEVWRPGVETRMIVSAETGARALCVFEQFVAPGAGAPLHTHTVEEVLTVLEGAATVWMGADTLEVRSGQSVVVAPGVVHGFTNGGTGRLHVQAILAAPVFEALAPDASVPTRRWAVDGQPA